MRIMFLSHMPRDPRDRDHHARIEASLQEYASPGTRVELCFPDDYPGSKVSEDLVVRNEIPGIHHLLQTPALVRKIVWAEQNGYDAVVQSNTFDPGVEAARQAVRIPVIGVFRTSLHVAASLTDAIGVVVPLESHVAYTWQIVHGYHMRELVKDIDFVGGYGPGVADRKAQVFARTVEVMRALVQRTRVGALIPLGGAVFPTLVSPADLEREVGVPVLNTKAIGIRFAELCVQLRLSHSSLTRPSAPLRYEDFAAYAYGPEHPSA
jgi:allantoin racemase